MPLDGGRYIASHYARRQYIREQLQENLNPAAGVYVRPGARHNEAGHRLGRALASNNSEELTAALAATPRDALDSLIARSGDKFRYCGHCANPFVRKAPHKVALVDREIEYCDTCCREGGPVVFSRGHNRWVLRRASYKVFRTVEQFEADTPDDWHQDGYDYHGITTGIRTHTTVRTGGVIVFVHVDIYAHVLDIAAARDREIARRGPDSPLNRIGAYHSSKKIVSKIPSQYDGESPPLLVGLEMEVELMGSAERAAEVVRNTFNAAEVYCGTERDGSLGNGFEIVTGYTGLDVHERVLEGWKKITDTLLQQGNPLSLSANCGLHVHLDRAELAPMHEYRLVKFMHDPAHTKFMELVARRPATRFCQKTDKTGAKKQLANAVRQVMCHKGMEMTEYHRLISSHSRASSSYARDRYEAVNMTNPKTIEFRLFKGSTDKHEIMAAAEFCRMVWLFTRDTPEAGLSTDNFVAYVCQQQHKRDTRYLRAFMKRVGIQGKIPTAKYELNYKLSDHPRTVIRQATGVTATLEQVRAVESEVRATRARLDAELLAALGNSSMAPIRINTTQFTSRT